MAEPSPPTADQVQQEARDLIQEIYGVTLSGQSKAFYVPLQFFAVVWGIEQADNEELFRDINDQNPLRFIQRSHDFARRLLNGNEIREERKRGITEDAETLRVLGKVFDALTVKFEFQKENAHPNRRHLQPYLGELIHHDFAPVRGGGSPDTDGIGLERVYYRGGGTLVYELLRADKKERRDQIAAELRKLLAGSNDPLGRTAEILHSADAVAPSSFTDTALRPHIEDRETLWAEHLREGTFRILTSSSSRYKKIDHLMYWLPYCVARHLVERAYSTLGITEESPTPVDTGAEGAVRRASQTKFREHRNAIRKAVVVAAGSASDNEASDRVRQMLHHEEFPDLDFRKKKKVEKTLTANGDFFATTMSTIGALNANTGLRHYTLKLPLLESIVHATVDKDAPIDFEDFCTEILCRKLRLVVDPASGQKESVTAWTDNEDLERNACGLADRLDALGLITSYSDATRKVGPRR
jgi:hypothetical protein